MTRILVIHSDARLGASIKHQLATPLVQPVHAQDVLEAVKLLEGFDFDIVIVDRQMLELVAAALDAARAAQPHLPIFIVDGSTRP